MISNFFTSAYRNFLRNRMYTILNITGLTFGLASFILIMAYAVDELSFDTGHEHSKRIYRLYENIQEHIVAVTPLPWGPALKDELSDIEDFVRLRVFNNVPYRIDTEIEQVERVIAADSSFFNVFSFSLISGDPVGSLNGISAIVITDEFAQYNFPDSNPIGQKIPVSLFGMFREFEITGVVEKPERSHITFDLIIPFHALKAAGDPIRHNDWTLHTSHTYLLLHEGTDPQAVEGNLSGFIIRYLGEEYTERYKPGLEPLRDIYLHSNHQLDFTPRGDIRHVYIFIAIACVILMIACINFINLSTAQSLTRAKEVGIRKVLGSNRSRLILQFLSESILLVFAALLAAVVLTNMFLPHFNQLTGKSITLWSLLRGELVSILFVTTLCTGVFAGCYPAIALSSFKSATVLKGHFVLTPAGGEIRKTLVVIQFAAASILLVFTGTIYLQLRYIENADLGFNRQHILHLPTNSRVPGWHADYELFKQKMKQYNEIQSVSASSSIPGLAAHNMHRYVPDGFPDGADVSITTIYSNYDFLDTFEIEFLPGSDITTAGTNDSIEGMIINEAAADYFKTINSDWAKPIDRELSFGFADCIANHGRVTGVTKNFHFEPLYKEIEPLVLRFDTANLNSIQIKLVGDNLSVAMTFIKDEWREVFPDVPFDYQFIDDAIRDTYRSEFRLMSIFKRFAILGIFIAALGVFGLSAFIVQKKMKEIHIRKILGATSSSLIYLLSKEFISMVLIANLIAWPVALKLVRTWLDNFVYKVGIDGWLFVCVLIFLTLFIFLTVLYQSLHVTRANPVHVLREE